MMKINLLLALLLACSGISSRVDAAFPSNAQGTDLQVQCPVGPRTVTTTGIGKVYTTPDRVVVLLSVKNWDRDLHTACAQNDSISQKVLSLAAKYKLPSSDVQSTQIYIEPFPDRGISSFMQSANKTPGYQVERKITFVLKNLKAVPDFLSDAADAGATGTSSMKFERSDLATLQDSARLIALRAAKETARSMAAELGAKVGKALAVRESTSGITDTGSPLARLAAAVTTIENTDNTTAGQLMVNSNVTVTFELTD
jgi:uncharacterized protein